MRYLIFIKGDGRGHITQALALTTLLRENGHEVCELIVGCPPGHILPGFLREKAPVPVREIYSPNFVVDAQARGISWSGTILRGLKDFPSLWRTRKIIQTVLQKYRPDVLINLFEPTLTLYALTSHLSTPILHISHQALMLHPDFRFPEGRTTERSLVLNYTRFVCLKSAKLLALSFYDFPDSPSQNIYPVAPLLRSEVFERKPTTGNHILVYLLNHGLATDLETYHRAHPDREIHAFWNNPDAPPLLKRSETLTFHRLNDTLFLDMMASCWGMACTAGFESVCEAFYYRKPAILMPAPSQYEQAINAFDAEKVGAGKSVASLDLNQLDDFTTHYEPQHEEYLSWLGRGKEKLLWHLENPTA